MKIKKIRQRKKCNRFKLWADAVVLVGRATIHFFSPHFQIVPVDIVNCTVSGGATIRQEIIV